MLTRASSKLRNIRSPCRDGDGLDSVVTTRKTLTVDLLLRVAFPFHSPLVICLVSGKAQGAKRSSIVFILLTLPGRSFGKMPVRVVESSAHSQVSGANQGHALPPAFTLLSVGQAFAGTQNVSSVQKDEAWRVNVRIQGCDLDHGYLCGTMEALNVPLADTPVVTFWEGEIVDTKNYTFITSKWEATPEDDVRHWSKFPSFSPLLSQVEIDGGKSLDLSNYPFIFMRWKEQYFVNVGIDCGLTIAGFYYVCFSCSDGSINGFYYDPNSSPFQKLELKSTNEGRSGFSFSSYQLQ